VSGVGESKLAKYGPGVLAVVSGGGGEPGAGATGDDPEWPDEPDWADEPPPDLFD